MAEKKESEQPVAPHPSEPTSSDPAPVGPHPSAPTPDAALTGQIRQFQADQTVLHAMAAPPAEAVAAEKSVEEQMLAGAGVTEEQAKQYEDEAAGKPRKETRTEAALEKPEPEKPEPKSKKADDKK